LQKKGRHDYDSSIITAEKQDKMKGELEGKYEIFRAMACKVYFFRVYSGNNGVDTGRA
jgi:hypothetical protein